jgi:PAS domain S-box-containing protein
MNEPRTTELAAQEATHDRELFRLLLDSVQDYAIFVLDRAGRVATWNRAAQNIKGYSAQEILGQHFSRFYTEDDVRSGKCERGLELATREGRFHDEGWRVRKDGSRFWASVIITPIRDDAGTVIGFAKVTRDLTEQRKAEEERIRLAQTQEAVRLRDEFLSIASHELRTPLTALHLQVNSLNEAIPSLDPKIANKVLRIQRSSVRLQALIDVLLDVSRIATGRFSMKKGSGELVATIQDMVDRFAEQAADASCEITLEKLVESAPGEWDMLRIEQALTNVLENALKYGAGKPVRVTVDGSPSAVTIVVEDEGPGIPEQDRERIFQRFERASSMRHYGGFGLGLYVSREILAAHGGTIAVENRHGGGARFTMRLPTTWQGDATLG